MPPRSSCTPAVRTTTFSSRSIPAALALSVALGLLPSAPARGQEAPSEAELVRAALERGPARARLEATRAGGAAASVAAPFLEDPVLEVRHEAARGPAGATTDAVGGSLVLGLGGLAEAQAARLRARAAGAWQRAAVVEAVCETRRGALDLWLAVERARAAGAAQERLERLLASVQSQVAAGEAAAHDGARLALAVAAHRQERHAAVASAGEARAALSALAGQPVSQVALLPLSPPAAASGVGPAGQGSAAEEALVQEALAADPVLVALREERDAAARSLGAARLAALPEVALSAGARWDGLPDGTGRTPGYEVGAGLSLPLFDRNQVEIAARRAELARLEAALVERQASVEAMVQAAWWQVDALGTPPPAVDAEATWQGSLRRHAAGETDLEELLAVAADVEAALRATAEGDALRRGARLALSCAVGAFPEPEIQALLEEHTR